MIYELKVTLKDVGIPVWRNIQIDASSTFEDLHRSIQAAFEWENYHMHTFFPAKSNGEKLGPVEIKTEDDEINDLVDFMPFCEDTFSEHKEILADWFSLAKDKVTYTYDFGDNWDHDIVLMKVLKRDPNNTYPRCTRMRNLSPPEDSRFDIIQGDIDLECRDTERLLDEVNELMALEVKDSVSEDSSEDYWQELFLKTKEFSKLKPWEVMADSDIFAVVDPITDETLFCSVLGANEETFGLGVYIGHEGYSVLMDILHGNDATFELLLRQRSLLLSFEDRKDIDQKDYDRIKMYDVPFRGRKAWPIFLSMKPGTEPWYMEEEEARMMLLAVGEAIDVYHQVDDGLMLPDIYNGDKVFAKVARDKKGTHFENEILDLVAFDNIESEEIPLFVSELELKRFRKTKSILPMTIEFALANLDMPIQNNPGERPELPLLVLAIDPDKGVVFHQNLLPNIFETEMMQREFLKMIDDLGGVPNRILMDKGTAHKLDSLLRGLEVDVEVYPVLPLVQEFIQVLSADLADY